MRSPGKPGPYVNTGFITALYTVTAFCVYKTLYSRKRNPLQTHADRMRAIEVIVKICVYTCVASVVFLSLNFTLVLLDMQSWEPLVQSIGNVTCALLYSMGLGATPIDPPQLDGLHSRPAA